MALFDDVLRELGSRAAVHGPNASGEYRTLCPFHEDKQHPNLHVHPENGFYCFACGAGGSISKLATKLGGCTKTRRKNKEIEAIYHYTDANGKPFEVVRFRPKGFAQRRPDGKGDYIWNLTGIVPILYHQDEVKSAIAKGEVVFIVEGEKDAKTLRRFGLIATTNVGGAGKWRDSNSDALRGGDLVIIPDNDQPGRNHAAEVACSCYSKAARIRVLELQGAKDTSDWLDSGHMVDELRGLASRTPEYEPPPDAIFSGLHLTLDSTEYFDDLNLYKIMSRTPQSRDDKPPMTKTLSSFIIRPKTRITLEGQGELLDTVLRTSSSEYSCLLRREAFNSKRQFMAELPSVDLQYYGNDRDTQAILAMVTSKQLANCTGTTVLGRNGDYWVLRDGLISKDGWVEDPGLIYIPSEIDFDRRVHYPKPKDETDLIKRVVPSLFMLNEGKIIFPVLAWFFSTPFVPEIRRRLRHFPLLVVWGTHGGGKSSLLRLLWKLSGVESELFSSTETAFTFLRLFSGSSTIPILIDEFKPFNMKEDETRLLIRYLKRLYDGEIEHRGRPDLSLVHYHLQAPTAIAGEVSPISLETAMGERVVQVNLNPDALTANPNYVAAYNELASLELAGFAFPYVRWCLGTDLDDLMDEARKFLPAIQQDVPPRVKDNILVMATGLVALKRFATQYGVKIVQKSFETGVEQSIDELLLELFERGVREEIGLTVFLQTLATLAQTKRIRPGVHYTTDDLNTRLYIVLPDCLAEFRKFDRETNARTEILDERAYRKQAREVCQRKGYVLSTCENKWFEMYETEGGSKGKIRSCIVIDMEALPFDTSGFEVPTER